MRQLRGLILAGRYAVGEKLPPERQLAQSLGVNRASLREALKRLELLGMVRTRQGDGTRVLDFMQTAGVDLVGHLLEGQGTPDLALIADVLEFRRWFGRQCARLAAERRTDEDLAALRAITERVRQGAAAPADLIVLDFEFYVALARAAKNRVMQLLINTVREAVTRFAPFFAQFMPSPAEVSDHHRALLEAIERRDLAGAERIADAYLGGAARALGAP